MDYEKLIKYGFKKVNNIYIYEKEILKGEFKLIIYVSDKITYKVIDNNFDEEFIMVGNGSFVNNIKEECDKIIEEIKNKCSKKTQLEIINKYINNKYNDNIEYLWKKYPNDGIYRNKINQKWYALIMKIKLNKLNIDSEEETYILNLMYEKEKINKIIDNKNIYPGYHMNKKSWITILLNGCIEEQIIYSLIDNSYNLSINKKS